MEWNGLDARRHYGRVQYSAVQRLAIAGVSSAANDGSLDLVHSGTVHCS